VIAPRFLSIILDEPTAEADRGRHPGFPSFNVIAGGPGSLAERSASGSFFVGEVSQAPDPYVQQRLQVERCLSVNLLITALDAMYLSWRFVALFAGWVRPGTGLCSWSERIDGDKVLQTPEARAFYVPHAILGLGFHTGCLWWWFLGRKLGMAYRPHLVRSLAVWLGVASLLTVWFWPLLLRLEALCPFCPWNHVLTYVALGLAIRAWRLTPHPPAHQRLRPLLYLVALCVGWFWMWQLGWIVAEQTGVLARAK